MAGLNPGITQNLAFPQMGSNIELYLYFNLWTLWNMVRYPTQQKCPNIYAGLIVKVLIMFKKINCFSLKPDIHFMVIWFPIPWPGKILI